MGGAGIQFAVRAIGARPQSQLVGAAALRGCLVSPSGTGSTYTATTARMIYAMEVSGTVPEVFGRVHPRYGIPRPAMWFTCSCPSSPVLFSRLGASSRR